MARPAGVDQREQDVLGARREIVLIRRVATQAGIDPQSIGGAMRTLGLAHIGAFWQLGRSDSCCGRGYRGD
jgi:hypothetical protein